MDGLTVRVLPHDEWFRLFDDGVEPFATTGILPDPAHWRVIVAERDGRIIGASSLYDTVHNDWWIAPEGQRQTAVGLGLWRQTMQELQAAGVQVIHATVGDPAVQAIVERLGYVEAPAKLYLLEIGVAPLNQE